MRRGLTVLAVFSFVLLGQLATTGAATAATADSTPVPVASRDSEPPYPVKPVIATYRGGSHNLVTEGWGNAQICAEYALGDVRCYDRDSQFRTDAAATGTLTQSETAAESAVSPQSVYDCPNGWACLWQDINYSGRRLQFYDSGNKHLADYNFRDQASSVANLRIVGPSNLVDYRTALPDPVLYLTAGYAFSDLTKVGYPGGVYGGGSWNDKADEFQL